MRSLILLSVLAFAPSIVLADEPDAVYVYENSVGGINNRFIIGPAGTPAGARYVLFENGSLEVDRLRYLGDREFRDGRLGTREIVKCWLYEGSDGTRNTWRILFGKETLANSNKYPVYYSLRDGDQFTRWLTNGGTTRRSGQLADQFSAALFQNQIDPSVFPPGEFSSRDLDPIYPVLAWDKCQQDVTQVIQRFLRTSDPVNTPLVLTKTPNGRYRFRIPQQPDAIQKALSIATGFPADAFIQMFQEKRVFSVQASQIKQEYRPGGSVELRLVANGFREILEDDANLLDQFQLSGHTRLQNDRVTTVSKPWQQLPFPDRKNAHYWRVKYELRNVGGEKWDLYAFIEIGKRPFSEPNRDDSIRWVTNTEDSPLYANFGTPAVAGDPQVVMRTETAYVMQGTNDEVVDVRRESNLSQRLEDVFKLCRRKVLNE